ncbi:hypothetical protein ACYPKM_00360 [Pseudomonas aeruginosa]
MTITQSQLEQLIDCTEETRPSVKEAQMMASEIMRLRSYGNMVPDADEELKQRAAILNKNLRDAPKLVEGLKRIQVLFKAELGTDLLQTLQEMILHLVGDTANLDTGDWIEMPVETLEQIDAVIHDAVGFGANHNVNLHNKALNNLRKFIQNAAGKSRTLVPKSLIGEADAAISEIVYGHKYSEKYRNELIIDLRGMLNSGPFPLPT